MRAKIYRLTNKMNNTPRVLNSVVKNDLCIGCGLCVYKCPGKALEMKWNGYGFLVPELVKNCDGKGSCITVCPFNPYPEEEVKTENELAEIYLKEATSFHPKVGKYENIYAGYANEFRATSSSGGLATFVMADLLERGIVNHIFSVKESKIQGVHYEYAVSNNKQELLAASKTKYYPVTLATVFSKIDELDGKVAIVGVACFIKAIRLAQHSDPTLKEKIPFLIGIICGGVKSRFFTEYLASKAGVSPTNYTKPEYRIKDENSTAIDYSFGCKDENDHEKLIKMHSVGDMWGTGMFKNNACDFCDDVTTELADISLGDAWLNPYNYDGKGTNVVITRSKMAADIITDGIINKNLNLDLLDFNLFLSSQQGSFNHRNKSLGYRIIKAKQKGNIIPPKRHCNENISLDFKLVQQLRGQVRQKSLLLWPKYYNYKKFDNAMSSSLKSLQIATKMYHYSRAIVNKLRKN